MIAALKATQLSEVIEELGRARSGSDVEVIRRRWAPRLES